jgi:hypothetical protein
MTEKLARRGIHVRAEYEMALPPPPAAAQAARNP